MHDAVKLSHERAKNDKVIVTATNTSNGKIVSCEASILFFKDGKLVDFDQVYLTNNNYVMDPGEKIIEASSNYEPYDNYEVYWTAYKW